MTKKSYSIIQCRTMIEVNTDPQRRCYNGCHAKTEIRWSSWVDLNTTPNDRIEHRLKFWKDLNEYAVSQRGEVGTLQEFRVTPIVEEESTIS
jgi:hypothetical protein